MTAEELQQAKTRHAEATEWGGADLELRVSRELIEEDVPALIAEVERLQEELTYWKTVARERGPDGV